MYTGYSGLKCAIRNESRAYLGAGSALQLAKRTDFVCFCLLYERIKEVSYTYIKKPSTLSEESKNKMKNCQHINTVHKNPVNYIPNLIIN